jgi:hypothetical protein
MQNDVTGRKKNHELTRYGEWRVRAMHRVAKALGLLVHIDGLPFGREQPPEPELKSGATNASGSL